MLKIKAAIVRHLGRVRFVPRFDPAGHPRREAIRAFLHGLRIKFLLTCGYGVVVVGRCRSGKTFLLERALPGRVIGPDMAVVLAGRHDTFDMKKMPEGMFAVDEANYFESSDLQSSFPALRARKVVFTVQALTLLARLKLDVLFEQRLAIVYLGSREEFLSERARTGVIG